VFQFVGDHPRRFDFSGSGHGANYTRIRCIWKQQNLKGFRGKTADSAASESGKMVLHPGAFEDAFLENAVYDGSQI
jgi:hypothetical protein